MQIYYLLPILLIGAAFAYSSWARKQVANMSPEQASERFHDSYAGYFDLNAGERVVGAWSGQEFQGAKSAAGHLAGAALNRLAAGTVGVSTYVPNVYVGLTSQGRVLVSREYSELGDRGHFKQIGDFAPGTLALGAGAARPGESVGDAPQNPYNPAVGMEFVQLRAPNGETYEAWMSPQGGQMGQPGFVSILQSLGGQS